MPTYRDQVLADGAVAYWRLGETSGTTAHSEVGTYPGTISGGVTLNQPGALADGNPSMAFDGTSGYVQVPPGAYAAIGTNPFTVELWLKYGTPVGGRDFPIDNHQASLGRGFSLEINDSDQIVIRVGDGSAPVVTLISPIPVGNVWHHFVFTVTRGLPDVGALYVDGVLSVQNNATSSGGSYSSANALSIGRLYNIAGTFNFTGAIDDVAIYHTALTPAQIANHYALRTAVPVVPGYLQARSGIERSGASRTGYYSYGVGIRWQQWQEPDGPPIGIDLSPYFQHGSLSIHESLNDEIDTAAFTLLPTCPIVPKAGESMTIRIGGVKVFAGQCVRIRQRWIPGTRDGAVPASWWDVECVDHLFAFDAKFVTNEYTNLPGAEVIRDVVDRVVQGGFSRLGVDPALPVIQNLPVTNQRPSTVLRSVTSAAGGGFFIDPDRVLHAFGAAGDIRYATPPRPLTPELKTLKQFGIYTDASQVRTVAVVEGQRSTTPRALPPGPSPTDPTVGYESIPVVDATMFEKSPPPGWPANYWQMRIGTQRAVYKAAYGPLDPTQNRPGSNVTQAALPGEGALYVADLTFASQTSVESRGWVEVANQILAYAGWTTIGGGPGGWLAIPASGYGSIQAPIGVQDAVTAIPMLYDVDPIDLPEVDADVFQNQPPGQPVVLTVVRQDEPAQDRWRKLSGSSGVRCHLMQDGRWTRASMEARGDADLAEFKDPRIVAEWETEDLNAEVGRVQAITMLGYTLSLTITNVDMVFPLPKRPPRRVCRAATIRPAGLLDILLTELG